MQAQNYLRWVLEDFGGSVMALGAKLRSSQSASLALSSRLTDLVRVAECAPDASFSREPSQSHYHYTRM
jgi:hypothetical protein